MSWPLELPASSWAELGSVGRERVLVCPELCQLEDARTPGLGQLQAARPLFGGLMKPGGQEEQRGRPLKGLPGLSQLPAGPVGQGGTSVLTTHLALGSRPCPCPGPSGNEASVRGRRLTRVAERVWAAAKQPGVRNRPWLSCAHRGGSGVAGGGTSPALGRAREGSGVSAKGIRLQSPGPSGEWSL